MLIIYTLGVRVVCHLDVDILQIALEICWLCRGSELLRINITNFVHLRVLSFTSHVCLTISILGGGRGFLNDFLIDLGRGDGIILDWGEFRLRRVMLHSCHVEELLTVQIIAWVPLFTTQSKVSVLFAKGAWVTSVARVLLGATTPFDVGSVDLLVGLLAFIHTSVGELLTVGIWNILDQLVEGVSVLWLRFIA